MASGYVETDSASSYMPLTAVVGSGMQQSFSSAYISHLLNNHQAYRSLKDGPADMYGSSMNHNINAAHAAIHETHIDDRNLLNAIPLVPDAACEVSSLSASSTDCQAGIKAFNQQTMMGFEPPSSHFQNWAENSPQAETSGSMDGEGKDEKMVDGIKGEAAIGSKFCDHERSKVTDSKVLRRLAQNREAARKSRLRKKAYVQQLETSRVKLNEIEQELERARQQGLYAAGANSAADSGRAAFNIDYARWVDEHNRQLSELRSALTTHSADNELRLLVDSSMAHYDDLFRLKGVAVKADVFHIVSGLWKTPAERCFMWMGGFRPSELLKILIPQLEPLTEQQLLAVCNLQQSSQQAEDALSQGMEALQQNLADTLSRGSLGPSTMVNYMGQMSMAMGKLATLENFVRQADNLRQQTLQQMHRILTIRQAARGLLAMGDYFSRLRALSSLWMARPRD